jgi:hypothetical protein
VQVEGSATAGAAWRRARLTGLRAQFVDARELVAEERSQKRKLAARQRPNAEGPWRMSRHAWSLILPTVGQRHQCGKPQVSLS